MTKDELRHWALARRQSFSPQQRTVWSRHIAERLCALPEIVKTASVLCYLTHDTEVDTRPCLETLWRQKICVLVPTKRMTIAPLTSWQDTHRTADGWLLPRTQSRIRERVPLVSITPALLLSHHGERIGSGRGLYDRFYASHPETYRIGIVFDALLFPTLPQEPHDIRMHTVVTNERVIH